MLSVHGFQIRNNISPPTGGGALARIISLSVPHWPTAAPHLGGAVAPVRRPHILHVASLAKSNRVNAEKAIQELRAEDWNREPCPPLGKSRYEQPTGGDGA